MPFHIQWSFPSGKSNAHFSVCLLGLRCVSLCIYMMLAVLHTSSSSSSTACTCCGSSCPPPPPLCTSVIANWQQEVELWVSDVFVYCIISNAVGFYWREGLRKFYKFEVKIMTTTTIRLKLKCHSAELFMISQVLLIEYWTLLTFDLTGGNLWPLGVTFDLVEDLQRRLGWLS